MSDYYRREGSADKLLKKLNKDKRLKEIAALLRSATGEDRRDLLEEREKLQEG